MMPQGLSSLGNNGPHGLSEILYCFAEAANNNGSAFAGLNANTPFYNVAAGIVIWIGRFIPIISILAIVGRLASKKTVEPSAGTLPTHGWTFGLTLTGVIIDRRGADLLPGALPGADCRARVDAGGTECSNGVRHSSIKSYEHKS